MADKRIPATIMQIELTISIEALPERVFAALTAGTAYWWGYLENKEAYDLVLEPKVGGRFLERWCTIGLDKEGSLLGTVIAIKPPELLRMQGPFGAKHKAVHNVISIELKRNEQSTDILFSHQAVGELDDESQLAYRTQWIDLLNRLKAFVEVHRGQGVRFDPYLESEPS